MVSIPNLAAAAKSPRLAHGTCKRWGAGPQNAGRLRPRGRGLAPGQARRGGDGGRGDKTPGGPPRGRARERHGGDPRAGPGRRQEAGGPQGGDHKAGQAQRGGQGGRSPRARAPPTKAGGRGRGRGTAKNRGHGGRAGARDKGEERGTGARGGGHGDGAHQGGGAGGQGATATAPRARRHGENGQRRRRGGGRARRKTSRGGKRSHEGIDARGATPNGHAKPRGDDRGDEPAHNGAGARATRRGRPTARAGEADPGAQEQRDPGRRNSSGRRRNEQGRNGSDHSAPPEPRAGTPPHHGEKKAPTPTTVYHKTATKASPKRQTRHQKRGTAASPEAEPGTPRDARRGGPRRPHPASECRGGERNRPYYKTGVRGVPGCGRHAASRSRFKVTRCFLVSVLGLAARAVATPAKPGSLYRCGSPNRGLG